MKILEVRANGYSSFSSTPALVKPFWRGVLAAYVAVSLCVFVTYLRHGLGADDAARLSLQWPKVTFFAAFVDDVPPRVVYMVPRPASPAPPTM